MFQPGSPGYRGLNYEQTFPKSMGSETECPTPTIIEIVIINFFHTIIKIVPDMSVECDSANLERTISKSGLDRPAWREMLYN